MSVLLADKASAEDLPLHERIKRALEMCGLNVDPRNPYQTIRRWVPLTSFVLYWGDRACRALKTFESQQTSPPPHHRVPCLQWHV